MLLNLLVAILVATLATVFNGLAVGSKAHKSLRLKAVPAANYCDKSLCPRGKPHIACNNTGALNTSCLANDTHLIDMSEHIILITRTHNELRQRLASGELKPLPKAARMATISWSTELAQMADYNAKICFAKHDECRNTPTFRQSGQNIAVFNLTHLEREEAGWPTLYPLLINSSMHAWWNESANATVHSLQSYPKDKRKSDFRHFAVMARENNTHVGCAAVHYALRNESFLKFTCNYAADYVPGKPVYQFRSSVCTTGRNRKYKHLCSSKELF